MRLLIIADAGGDDRRHIGDEAMLEANLDSFRAAIPGVTFTVITRDPTWITARYGVDAVKRASEAIANVDAVILSGGGNLSSSWPELLRERADLLRLAHKSHKPSIVLGQTIGPNLTAEDRRQLAETLSLARMVGVREARSARLAEELGVERLWYQCDDAMFLSTGEGACRSTMVVTVDSQLRGAGEILYGRFIKQLRELARRTRATLTLIPHAWGSEPSDLTEARVLAERVGVAGTVVAENLSAREAKRMTGESSLVISTRYHPIVFALASAVPAIGIYVDEYCRIQSQGALAQAGLERYALSYGDVADGKLLKSALALWQKRDEVKKQIESHRERWAEEYRLRWQIIPQHLNGNGAGISQRKAPAIAIEAPVVPWKPTIGQRLSHRVANLFK